MWCDIERKTQKFGLGGMTLHGLNRNTLLVRAETMNGYRYSGTGRGKAEKDSWKSRNVCWKGRERSLKGGEGSGPVVAPTCGRDVESSLIDLRVFSGDEQGRRTDLDGLCSVIRVRVDVSWHSCAYGVDLLAVDGLSVNLDLKN